MYKSLSAGLRADERAAVCVMGQLCRRVLLLCGGGGGGGGAGARGGGGRRVFRRSKLVVIIKIYPLFIPMTTTATRSHSYAAASQTAWG